MRMRVHSGQGGSASTLGAGQQRDLWRRVWSNVTFAGAIVALCTVLIPARESIADNAASAAVAYCAQETGTGPAFAYCVGGILTKEELQKCLSGSDCFGKNNEVRKIVDGIRTYGICGGPNSALRHLLGHKGCGSIDCTNGPFGTVTLINNTGRTVHFTLESKCGSLTSLSVKNGYSDEFLGGHGDQWFNIAIKSDGGLVQYGLDTGMTYEFKWRGELLDLVDDTPRYVDSPEYKRGAP